MNKLVIKLFGLFLPLIFFLGSCGSMVKKEALSPLDVSKLTSVRS